MNGRDSIALISRAAVAKGCAGKAQTPIQRALSRPREGVCSMVTNADLRPARVVHPFTDSLEVVQLPLLSLSPECV